MLILCIFSVQWKRHVRPIERSWWQGSEGALGQWRAERRGLRIGVMGGLLLLACCLFVQVLKCVLSEAAPGPGGGHWHVAESSESEFLSQGGTFPPLPFSVSFGHPTITQVYLSSSASSCSSEIHPKLCRLAT